MKELAVHLVNFDWTEMKKFILAEIEKQHQDQFFNFDTLNSLSWIVGSLCGAIMEKE